MSEHSLRDDGTISEHSLRDDGTVSEHTLQDDTLQETRTVSEHSLRDDGTVSEHSLRDDGKVPEQSPRRWWETMTANGVLAIPFDRFQQSKLLGIPSMRWQPETNSGLRSCKTIPSLYIGSQGHVSKCSFIWPNGATSSEDHF